MEILGASAEPPADRGDYMKVKVVDVRENDRTIVFKPPFDRYRIAPEYMDGIYDITSSDNVIASIRMKKGEGVIEGVFVNGVPLEASSTGAAMAAKQVRNEKTTAPKVRIVESSMVPPKEE